MPFHLPRAITCSTVFFISTRIYGTSAPWLSTVSGFSQVFTAEAEEFSGVLNKCTILQILIGQQVSQDA